MFWPLLPATCQHCCHQPQCFKRTLHTHAWLPLLQMQVLFTHSEVLNHMTCCFKLYTDVLPCSMKQNSSEYIDLRTTYFIVFIIADCVVLYKVYVTFTISSEASVTTNIWVKCNFTFYLLQLVLCDLFISVLRLFAFSALLRFTC